VNAQPADVVCPAALLEAALAAMPDEDAEALARIKWLETRTDQHQDLEDYQSCVGID
jgi:hypothetical protein